MIYSMVVDSKGQANLFWKQNLFGSGTEIWG